MAAQPLSACALTFLFFCAIPARVCCRATGPNEENRASASQASKAGASKQGAPAKQSSPEEELQQAINDAGNDRVALVRNLEAFLKKYPDSRQRPQIYRALVEANLQLRDKARAADYATRVLEFVERSSPEEKSPKISQEEWATERKRDRMSLLALRGRLKMKLQDTAAAQKDFEASYAILPSATAAEQLGEIAELKKDLKAAIQQYARAFALADAVTGSPSRREIRQKLGNVWRLARGSDIGLGEYLLLTFDDLSQASSAARPRKNADAREPSEFTLRKAPEGTPFPLKDVQGKVLVVNFWATWCGPCHALEPQFARVAAEFLGNPDVLFLAANCDEDESLVTTYLEADKPHTAVVFADGLDRLLAINAFPTVIVIERGGKIAYRSDGFEPLTFEQDLLAAVRRALAGANNSAAGDGFTP